MDLFNYKDNCRLCLKTHTDFMKNIFTHSVEGCQDTVVQNIFALFRVELNPHEDYPQFICRKCLTELENILLFKEDLQRNQDFLLSLFTAAYPNYVEKVDTEYIRVPINFIKQLSPQVLVQLADLETSVKERPELKKEIIQNDLLTVKQEQSVNICKYCNKEFRSQILVDNHCKKVHEVEGQQKKNVTRKRISSGTQRKLAKKVKTDENKNVPVSNLPRLPAEQISLPQIYLQNNNNVGVKAELFVTPTVRQKSRTESTESAFQKNQALFLQNFNLIAKQEAALIKTNQKSPKSLPKRLDLKKQIVPKSIKKTVVKPLKPRNVNKVVKPLSVRAKRRKSKNNDPDMLLRRSVEFLKRYGWRDLNSSSRRGTVLNAAATKSIPKKISFPKNSTKSSVLGKKSKLKYKNKKSKTDFKDKGCEIAHNLENPDRELVSTFPGLKVERSNSLDNLSCNQGITAFNTNQNNVNFTTISMKIEEKPVFKESPTSSVSSDKKQFQTFSGVENTFYTKLESVVKSETSSTSSDTKDDEAKRYQATPSRSFYDNSTSNTSIESNDDKKRRSTRKSPLYGIQSPLSSDPSLNPFDSLEYVERTMNNNEAKLSHRSLVQKKSEKLLGNRNRNANSLRYHDNPQTKHGEIALELDPFRPGSTDSFTSSETKPETDVWSYRNSIKKFVSNNTNSSEVEKELKIQLEKREPFKKRIGFGEPLVDVKFEVHNSDEPETKPEVPDLDTLTKGDDVKCSKRCRSKKIDDCTLLQTTNFASTSCNESNNSSLSLARGRSRPTKNLKAKLVSDISCNCTRKVEKNSDLSTPIDNNKKLKTNDSSETIQRRGRPKKDPVLEGSPSSSVLATNTVSSRFARNDRTSPIINNEILNTRTSSLDKALKKLNCTPSFNTQTVKNEDLSILQDLNDRYEVDANIGLRIKLRKKAGCESLNSIKYDTQEFDDKFEPEAETIHTKTNLHFNNVPDNEKLSANRDKMIKSELISEEGSTPEKIVNVNLEDEEVQMLVLVSDYESVDFDDGDISKFVKCRKGSLDLEQSDLLSRSKSCLPLEESSSYFSNDEVTKRSMLLNRSQTCLPLNKYKLKNIDHSISKTDLLTNRLRSRSSVGSEDIHKTQVKRIRRPPVKFSPSTYETNRTKSASGLGKNSVNNGVAELTPKKYAESRSRSASQSYEDSSGIELCNETKKRGRSSKTNPVLLGRSDLAKKHDQDLQQKNITKRQSVLNPLSLKKVTLNPPTGLAKNGSLVQNKAFNNRAVHDKLNTQKEKEKKGFIKVK